MTNPLKQKQDAPDLTGYENPDVPPGTIVMLLENATEEVSVGRRRTTTAIRYMAGDVVYVEEASSFGARFTLDGVDGRRPEPRETVTETRRRSITRSLEPEKKMPSGPITEVPRSKWTKPWGPPDREALEQLKREREKEPKGPVFEVPYDSVSPLGRRSSDIAKSS